MMDYLVAISIGPVQSLIEAGRKAQDLWCGSWLLSEVSRAVARVLHAQQHDCLIFPNPSDPETELKPQGEEDTPKANIANVVRAVVTVNDEQELTSTIQQAKEAAAQRLNDIFARVLAGLHGSGTDHDIWQKQQNDVLETFAAWVSLDNHDYSSASKRLGQLLVARKQTRDFDPMTDSEEGLHKSHLDGTNNTVIKGLKDTQVKRKLGLTSGEQLDALGVVKRLAGPSEQFTPFNRIVADSWIKQLEGNKPETLKALSCAYQKLVSSYSATPVKGNDGCYQSFPYDAEYLFLSRLEQASDIEEDIKAKLQESLTKIGSVPVPYGVLLKADGDRMGELFAQAKTPKTSRLISSALHCFAMAVRKIVREHRGHAVYAGGDDVLAFLPLEGALACASELASEFAERMLRVAKESGLNIEQSPTLSVGLAVGHFVQPMRQLRHRAVAAEKHAKGDGEPQPRNALAIHLGIRSGHEIQWRCCWTDSDSLTAMGDFVQAFASEKLPSRISQDVREMAQRLQWTYSPDVVGIRHSELCRMLDRATLPGEGDKINDSLKKQLLTMAEQHSLAELANQLLIARWLSTKVHTETGELA